MGNTSRSTLNFKRYTKTVFNQAKIEKRKREKIKDENSYSTRILFDFFIF